MILAEDELGIGSDHAGILVLDDDLEPGQPLVDALPIATDVIELEITPNRPDCLGVYGLAREVHAITGAPLADPAVERGPRLAGAGAGRRGRGRGRRAVPALHRARVRRRAHRARRRRG